VVIIVGIIKHPRDEVFAKFLKQCNAVWPRIHFFFCIDHMYPSLETILFDLGRTTMSYTLMLHMYAQYMYYQQNISVRC